jgi:hypothetical protein
MIAVVQAFAPHYARARVLFLEAAATAGLASESYVSPHTGIAGETLATDVALDGTAGASRLLLVTSGSRGMDGTMGSGVQVFALHDQEWRDKARSAGVAVLYVHALDPWAFSWQQPHPDANWANTTLRAILREHAQHARHISWIDLRTANGEPGWATRTTAGPQDETIALLCAESPLATVTGLLLEIGAHPQPAQNNTDAWKGQTISQARQTLFQAVDRLSA